VQDGAQVEIAMPKKRGAASVQGYANAEQRFLQRTAAAIAAHVDFERVRCLLLAGPGFARDKLRAYLIAQGATVEGNRAWQQNKEAIISVPASSAYLQAIPVRCHCADAARPASSPQRSRVC
jgi:protein pelota